MLIYMTLHAIYGLSHPILFPLIGQMSDMTMVADTDECALSSVEPLEQREEPLGSLNGKAEPDDKENNNGISSDEVEAVRYDWIKTKCSKFSLIEHQLEYKLGRLYKIKRDNLHRFASYTQLKTILFLLHYFD